MPASTPDLFGHTPPQADLFADEPARAERKQVDPDKIRLWMESMLSDLRGAEGSSPWPHETLRLNQVIFPQMSNWLPAEERAQMCFAFESELKRLNLAA
jgi:hypothetical protein